MAEPCQRLAEQLHTLSHVVETITYRLLDLEERVAAQAQRLQALVEEGPPGSALASAASAQAQVRLDDTENRLLRLESMLSGVGDNASSGRLSLVGSPRSAPLDARAGDDGEESCAQDIDGPFPEEPEQPFLDDFEDVAEDAEAVGGRPQDFLTA